MTDLSSKLKLGIIPCLIITNLEILSLFRQYVLDRTIVLWDKVLESYSEITIWEIFLIFSIKLPIIMLISSRWYRVGWQDIENFCYVLYMHFMS
ncbi:hypothetical protein AGMMS49938_13240 [Fibrobacterales bacterium]|nr:hypothetical protein AGMMS49938_13240 [Fibrobacterales bacterium]